MLPPPGATSGRGHHHRCRRRHRYDDHVNGASQGATDERNHPVCCYPSAATEAATPVPCHQCRGHHHRQCCCESHQHLPQYHDSGHGTTMPRWPRRVRRRVPRLMAGVTMRQACNPTTKGACLCTLSMINTRFRVAPHPRSGVRVTILCAGAATSAQPSGSSGHSPRLTQRLLDEQQVKRQADTVVTKVAHLDETTPLPHKYTTTPCWAHRF